MAGGIQDGVAGAEWARGTGGGGQIAHGPVATVRTVTGGEEEAVGGLEQRRDMI